MPKNKDTEYRYIKTQVRLIIKSIIQTLKKDLESVDLEHVRIKADQKYHGI